MRVISWNLGVGSPESGSEPERAWEWLRDEADADVLLLQEAVPPDWARDAWTAVVHAPKYTQTRQPWGCVVLARDPVIEAFVPGPATPWLSALWGSVAVAAPAGPGGRWFASIHSRASAVAEGRFAPDALKGVPRCDPDAIWEIDLIAHDLAQLFSGRRFVAGGDLNSALLLDVKNGYDHNARLFANLRELGLVDTRPRHEPREVQTYFKDGVDAYQLDHLFADPSTESQGSEWGVVTPLATTDRMSDHAPIVWEVDD